MWSALADRVSIRRSYRLLEFARACPKIGGAIAIAARDLFAEDLTATSAFPALEVEIPRGLGTKYADRIPNGCTAA
jgi:hypothetical protein